MNLIFPSLLLLLSVQVTNQAPTSRSSRHPILERGKQAQVNDHASSSHTSLSAFVDQKPIRLDDLPGQKYMRAFGRHPSIRRINLKEELLALSTNEQDSKRMHKMNALIDRHLTEKGANPQLVSSYKGQRWKMRRNNTYRARRAEQMRLDPVGLRLKEAIAREKSKAKKQIEKKRVPELSEFLGAFIDPKMTPVEVAEMARAYRSHYGFEGSYTRALIRYLKANNFSKVRNNAATGWTAMQVGNEKRRKYKGTMQGLLGAGLSSRYMQWAPVELQANAATTSGRKKETSATQETFHGRHGSNKIMPQDWWKTHHL